MRHKGRDAKKYLEWGRTSKRRSYKKGRWGMFESEKIALRKKKIYIKM